MKLLIPQANDFSKIELVDKGWSQDKKYYVETKDGKKLLLRLADRSEYKRKEAEFAVVRKISALGIPMSQPIDLGLTDDGIHTYSLFTWVQGEDAGQVVPSLSLHEQFELGFKAGQYLRSIHNLAAPEQVTPWADRYKSKIDRNIKNYLDCPIKFSGDEQVIKFVQENINLLDERGQSLQHGDYHLGNMVYSRTGELGIIDFNRWDYGDPWEEFNRIVMSSNISKAFAKGQVEGYFEGPVPDRFFRLMALYIATNALATTPWSIPFGDKEVQWALDNINDMLIAYEDFKTYIPSWYRG